MSCVIAWVVSVGFPTIATYKALKGNDLSQMRPWLMYWAVLELVKTAETLLSPVLNYVLLYSWLRILGAVWLVSRGAVELWTQRVEPNIRAYEPNLDSLMTDCWNRVKGKTSGGVAHGASGTAGGPAGGAAGTGNGQPPPTSIFSMFSRPVSSDALIEAVFRTWRAPTTTEQVTKQRSYLQAMLNALDKDTEEFISVDDVAPVNTRRGWLW